MESQNSIPASPLILSLLSFLSLASAASVVFPGDAVPTQSGFLPVAASRSAIYYAYYEARCPRQPLSRTPLLVWLQGGPGCSSLLANFFELGPWLVSNSTAAGGLSLAPNPYSWNRLFGLLFLDNPVGSGFSIAAEPSEIPRNQTAVARHLWLALQAFFSSNPSFRPRPFYLTGESYAGKYVPAAGYHILRRNARVAAARRINLLGVAVGNGLTHPVAQVATHADSAFFSGLVNERQRAELEKLQSEAVALTTEHKWAAAADARDRVLRLLGNQTGLATLYDLSKGRAYQTGVVDALLAEAAAKAALGVGEGAVWDSCSEAVAAALREDIMKSVKREVEWLVARVRVLLYQGLYDLRDGVVSTAAWVREMEWEGLEGYLAAERKVWRVGEDGRLAGYVQSHGRLSEVVVAGAGHLVPADRGMAAQAMIEDWVLGRGHFAGAREATAADDCSSSSSCRRR